MDQIKIGKFIQAMRKEQSLTQKQLADKLMISDKTISKWETGNGLPEVAIMIPLCDLLGINVNELLSGERLSDAAYYSKAEENMMSLIKEKEENRRKLVLSIFTGVVSTAVFTVIILIVCFYTDIISVPVKIALVVFACVVFGLGIFETMALDRECGYFVCQNCGKIFTPAWSDYLIAPHVFTRRFLKCPYCGQRTCCNRVLSK